MMLAMPNKRLTTGCGGRSAAQPAAEPGVMQRMLCHLT